MMLTAHESQSGSSCTPSEREREAVERDAEADRDGRRRRTVPPSFAHQGSPRVSSTMPTTVATAAPSRMPRYGPVERQECERRHEHGEEQREAAEPRDRPAVHPALLPARLVDDAEEARDAADGGRQREHDGERHEEAPEHVLVVEERVKHSACAPP